MYLDALPGENSESDTRTRNSKERLSRRDVGYAHCGVVHWVLVSERGPEPPRDDKSHQVLGLATVMFPLGAEGSQYHYGHLGASGYRRVEYSFLSRVSSGRRNGIHSETGRPVSRASARQALDLVGYSLLLSIAPPCEVSGFECSSYNNPGSSGQRSGCQPGCHVAAHIRDAIRNRVAARLVRGLARSG